LVLLVLLISTSWLSIAVMVAKGTPAQSRALPKPPATFTVAPLQAASPIARENQLPGTTAWELDPHVSTTFIQGYAGAVSAQAGETVPLYISTVVPASFRLAVYRIGWYGGLGGRLMLAVPHLQSLAQGFWTPQVGLTACTSCRYDPTTNLVDAHWTPTYTLRIPTTWLSGVYLIKLAVGRIAESYIPLVVRDDASTASALVNIPFNTYEAYNLWGGYSLYEHVGQMLGTEQSALDRATKVSFNRPFDRSAGAGDFLLWDIHTVRWLERSAIDVTYTTSVDVAVDPAQVLRHRVYIDSGHDEYWTKSMRDGIEAARDQGVNLAFLGANDAYWQVRLEADAAQHPNRTLVCYKVVSRPANPSQDLKNDPMYPTHPELVTTQWRDSLLHRPENSLLGLMYNSLIPSDGRYVPALVIAPVQAGDTLAQMVGLTGGEQLTSGLVGYEYDSLFQDRYTPNGLVILAASPVINLYHKTEIANSAYYRAASGALVFDAGTLWWGHGLDDFIPPGSSERPFFHEDQTISNLTATLLQAMLTDNGPLFAPTLTRIAPNAVPLPTR
jgi:hypothetical protein